MDDLGGIIQELNSIIRELRDIESELRSKFKGIGTENFVADKLSGKTDKLDTALRKLRSVDKTQVDE